MSVDNVLKRLHKEYVSSFSTKIENLKKLSNTPHLLTEEFHKLKGSGRTYGVAELSLLAEQMERLGKIAPEKLNEHLLQGLQLFQKIKDSRDANLAFAIESDADFNKLKGQIDEIEKQVAKDRAS